MHSSRFLGRLPGVLLVGLSIAAALAVPPRAAAQDEPTLTSPVYADYNTFLGVTNILELIAVGDRAVEVTINVYRLTGARDAQIRDSINPGEQKDYIINDLLSDSTDTYGIVEVQFNSPQGELEGRMSYYRLNSDGSTYSFAFSRQLNQTVTGVTHAVADTIDPQQMNFLVPNWLQLTNLSATTEDFAVNLYDQAGGLVRSTELTLAPFQRFDLSGGHELGQQLFLMEVVPDDADTRYLAALTRYGWNIVPGGNPRDFAFAVSHDTRAGSGSDQFAFILNRSGACFRETNWVELVNTASSATTFNLELRDAAGNRIAGSDVTLAPRAQMHINASLLLDRQQTGSVEISNMASGALLANSTVYVQNCGVSNRLQTAFSAPALTPEVSPVFGSINTFLEQDNELILVNTTPETRPVDITARFFNPQTLVIEERSDQRAVGPLRTFLLNVNDDPVFGLVEGTVGGLSIDSEESASFVGYVLRTRRNADGTSIDFVNATFLR